MPKRPASDNESGETSDATATSPELYQASKRPRLDNSNLPIAMPATPTPKSRSQIERDCSATSPSRNLEASANEQICDTEEEQKLRNRGTMRTLRHSVHGDEEDDDPGQSRSKRRRRNRDTQRCDRSELLPPLESEGDTSGSRSTAQQILDSIYALPKEVERRNNNTFRYTPFNTENEGTKPVGTEEWKAEQRIFLRLQNEAIAMLNDPDRRQDPDFGLLGNRPTPIQRWARRLEADRLIKLGLSPWHLEFGAFPCSYLEYDSSKLQPGTIPIIPESYIQSHRDEFEEHQRKAKAKRLREVMKFIQEHPGDKIVEKLREAIEWPEDSEIQVIQEAHEHETELAGQPIDNGPPVSYIKNQSKANKKPRKRNQKHGQQQQPPRRSLRRKLGAALYELDNHNRAQICKEQLTSREVA